MASLDIAVQEKPASLSVAHSMSADEVRALADMRAELSGDAEDEDYESNAIAVQDLALVRAGSFSEERDGITYISPTKRLLGKALGDIDNVRSLCSKDDLSLSGRMLLRYKLWRLKRNYGGVVIAANGQDGAALSGFPVAAAQIFVRQDIPEEEQVVHKGGVVYRGSRSQLKNFYKDINKVFCLLRSVDFAPSKRVKRKVMRLAKSIEKRYAGTVKAETPEGKELPGLPVAAKVWDNKGHGFSILSAATLGTKKPVSMAVFFEVHVDSEAKYEYTDEYKLGELTEHGIYVGVWEPKDENKKSLGRVFNLFADKRDLSSSKLTFNDVVEHVAKLSDGFNHASIFKKADKVLYDAISAGEYQGELFIPTMDILQQNLYENKGLSGLRDNFYWSCTPNISAKSYHNSNMSNCGMESSISWSSNRARLVRAIPVQGA